MSRHATSCHVMPRHVTSRHVTSRHITSPHVTSHHVTSRYVTLRNVTSRYVTLRYAALRYAALRCAALRCAGLRCAALRRSALKGLSRGRGNLRGGVEGVDQGGHVVAALHHAEELHSLSGGRESENGRCSPRPRASARLPRLEGAECFRSPLG